MNKCWPEGEASYLLGYIVALFTENSPNMNLLKDKIVQKLREAYDAGYEMGSDSITNFITEN